MYKLAYKPSFTRTLKKLEKDLQEEVFEKLELLKDKSNHQHLRVHKLKGELGAYYSFSVNYKIRIVFRYHTKQEILILGIGDHDIYR